MPTFDAPTCPNCGARLEAVVASNAQTPPWACYPCSRGWWDAETTTNGRVSWNPELRCHTGIFAKATQAAIQEELAGAHLRGTAWAPGLIKKLGTSDLNLLVAQLANLPGPGRKAVHDETVRRAANPKAKDVTP